MRAYEFLSEHRLHPSRPITLKALNQIKLDMRRREKTEKERHALMAIMYADPTDQQAQLDLERQRLELDQLRAEIAATKAETRNKSATALHNSAKRGIKSAKKQQQKLTKQAKSGLGRELKP